MEQNNRSVVSGRGGGRGNTSEPETNGQWIRSSELGARDDTARLANELNGCTSALTDWRSKPVRRRPSRRQLVRTPAGAADRVRRKGKSGRQTRRNKTKQIRTHTQTHAHRRARTHTDTHWYTDTPSWGNWSPCVCVVGRRSRVFPYKGSWVRRADAGHNDSGWPDIHTSWFSSRSRWAENSQRPTGFRRKSRRLDRSIGASVCVHARLGVSYWVRVARRWQGVARLRSNFYKRRSAHHISADRPHVSVPWSDFFISADRPKSIDRRHREPLNPSPLPLAVTPPDCVKVSSN